MDDIRFNQDSELRMDNTGSTPRISGYALVYNSLSRDLGGFKEVIRPGAATESLRSNLDVIANIEHDNERMLGRKSSGTLTLHEDARGVRFQVDVPDTSYGRDLLALMKRGDISGASFRFANWTDKFRNEPTQVVRELHSFTLHDVSVVREPAYPAAEAALRSYKAWKEQTEAERKARQQMFDRWARAAEKLWG